MPLYRIFRMRDHDRQRFRSAPHTSGTTMVKPREYVESGTVEAVSPYTAWTQLKDTEEALGIGDVLVAPNDQMLILKYIGFEEAKWVLPAEVPVELQIRGGGSDASDVDSLVPVEV